MKRYILLVFALFCAVCLFSCTNRIKEPVVLGNAYSDIEGISVEIVGLYNYNDMKTLVVSWNNNTQHNVTYGEMYFIERFENGKWVDCSTKENIFTLLGYSLNTNEKVDKEYRITDMYDISNPGTYRFRSNCYLDTGNQKECSVWVEFVIE